MEKKKQDHDKFVQSFREQNEQKLENHRKKNKDLELQKSFKDEAKLQQFEQKLKKIESYKENQFELSRKKLELKESEIQKIIVSLDS